jgi:hypothetical protein
MISEIDMTNYVDETSDCGCGGQSKKKQTGGHCGIPVAWKGSYSNIEYKVPVTVPTTQYVTNTVKVLKVKPPSNTQQSSWSIAPFEPSGFINWQ